MTTVAPLRRTSGAPIAPLPPTRRVQPAGGVERFIAVVTIFVVAFAIPSFWFTSSNPEDVTAEPAAGTPLLILTLLLVGLLYLRILGAVELQTKAMAYDPYLTAWVAFATASFLWSDDPAKTIYAAVTFVAVYLLAVYLTLRYELTEVLQLAGWALLAGTFGNFALIFGRPAYGRQRIGADVLWDGLFTHKNHLGLSSAAAMLLLVVLAGAKRGHRFLWYGAAAANAVLVVGSGSRTMMGAGVGALVLLAAYHAFRARGTLRGGVILSLGTMTAFLMAWASANIDNLTEQVGKNATLTGRTTIWADVLDVIEKRPIAGWGLAAAFNGYGSPVHELWIKNDWEPDHAHNAVLQNLADLGAIGAGLFLASLIWNLHHAVGTTAKTRGRVALWPLAFVSFAVVISGPEPGYAISSFTFLLYCIAAMAIGRMRDATTPLGPDSGPGSP